MGSESFTGYSQGEYCEVVYCVNHYTPERITEIGELWLGCGTEFALMAVMDILSLKVSAGEKVKHYGRFGRLLRL